VLRPLFAVDGVHRVRRYEPITDRGSEGDIDGGPDVAAVLLRRALLGERCQQQRELLRCGVVELQPVRQAGEYPAYVHPILRVPLRIDVIDDFTASIFQPFFEPLVQT
jgi:hypothetical protein